MTEALRHWAEARLTEQAVAAAQATREPHWQPLPVEASHRRFYRLRLDADVSFVVMSSPPELENNDQFVTLAEVFAEHGVGVPVLLASDPAAGFFLMTDLGERHFADVYQDPGPAAAIPEALRTLHRLQQIDDPRVPEYTRARFADELDIYRIWCLEKLLDGAAPAPAEDALMALLDATDRQPRCCVHRDFHARNLLLVAPDQVGVVDFQDALRGPATYDLASLLRDCYHHFPEHDVARWRDLYLATTMLPVDPDGFPRDLDFTALQRQLKAVGIFARLSLRDGRDSHLAHIVPVLIRIRDLAAAYPETVSLAEHVDAVLPAARQRLGVTA
jgi:aminoglycoside/choline kinase family phosphotransferase